MKYSTLHRACSMAGLICIWIAGATATIYVLEGGSFWNVLPTIITVIVFCLGMWYTESKMRQWERWDMDLRRLFRL